MENLKETESVKISKTTSTRKNISEEVRQILNGEKQITFNFVSYNTPEGREELKQVKRAQQECLNRKNVDRNELNKFRCNI